MEAYFKYINMTILCASKSKLFEFKNKGGLNPMNSATFTGTQNGEY
jgi:hypothetical protein